MTDWVQEMIAQGGYLGVFLLMFGETIFPPIPSEVIMSMAGLQAAKGTMSLGWAILFGAAGAMLGNLVWYIVARWLGLDRFKPLIDRYGRWLTMDWAEVNRGERWFERHGYLFVFLGRMMPTIRSLVSIPAGLVKMPLTPFLIWSSIGTLGWTAMLAIGGWILGTQFSDMEAWLGIFSILLIASLVAWYLWRVATWRPSR